MPLAIAKSAAPRDALGHDAGDAPRARRRGRRLARRQGRGSSRCPRRPPPPPAQLAGRMARPTRWKPRRRTAAAAARAATSISIALQPAASNAVWLKRLEAAEPAARRAIYLDERSGNAMNVGFFLDAAEFFIAQGERALGLRILSNLAEMDLQNRQVLRLLAYRLQQAGEVANALPLFERVLELAPNEPQSHRDLGLALAEAGPGAEGRRPAVRGGHRPLGRALPRHRPDRPRRAQRRRRQGGARRQAGRRRGDRAAAAEEPAARRARGPGLGRRRDRRRPARDRSERRRGLLRPQPLLAGRHDQPRRDRRLRTRGVRAQGRQARASTGSRPTSSATGSRCSPRAPG